MFRSNWVHLESFRNYMKLGAKRGELVQLMQKFVTRSCLGIFCNEHNQSTPLDPKLMFWCVWYCLDAFGIISFPYETHSKWTEVVQLMQKFMPRSRVRIFCNKRTRSTTLDPKLMFLFVSYYFSAVGTVWLACKTWWKMGRTGAKVRATKSHWNFSQRTQSTPLDPKLRFWCVSYYLGAFGTVWLP